MAWQATLMMVLASLYCEVRHRVVGSKVCRLGKL